MKSVEKYDEKTKERILLAAKKHFAEWGFSGARMANIAKDADVNKALIHYYFKTKEQLYVEILKRIIGVAQKPDVPIYVGKWDLTPPQKMRVLIYFAINLNFIVTDPDCDRIIAWEIAEKRTHMRELINTYIDSRRSLFIRVIQEGVVCGDFEADYPLWTMMYFFSFLIMYNNVSEFFKSMPDYIDLDKENGIDKMCDFLMTQMFKSLRPVNKPLDIPELPDDLMIFLNTLIDYLKEKKDEGVTEGIMAYIYKIFFPEG